MAIGCQENKTGAPEGWWWKIKKNRKGLQLVTSLISPRTVFGIVFCKLIGFPSRFRWRTDLFILNVPVMVSSYLGCA
jgi:hypothetical protein